MRLKRAGQAIPANRGIRVLPEATILLKLSQEKGLQGAAAFLGCHEATLVARLKDAGLYGEGFKPVKSISKEDLEQLYYRDRLSFSALAKRFDCAVATIQDRFRKFGLVARSKGNGVIASKRSFDDQHIIDTYLGFQSTIAAASELDMSPQGVDWILRKHGVVLTGNQKPLKNGGERVVAGWLSEWGMAHEVCWHGWPSTLLQEWHHVDLYVPDRKAFIEFNGVSYHSSPEAMERDQRKKDAFLAAYPDHRWLVVTDEEISNKSRKEVAKHTLQTALLGKRFLVEDLTLVVGGDRAYAMNFLDRFHDRGRPSVCNRFFTLQLGGTIVAVAAFGPPQDSTSTYDVEFKRLAFCPGLPRNTPSWFIQRCVREFESGCRLVTYIDSDHLGSSFKGCNWVAAGTTDPANAYHYESEDGKVSVGRRKAYDLAKKAGLQRSAWVLERGLHRVKEPVKQIFELVVPGP